MSKWVCKELEFAFWVSAKWTFRKECTATHRQFTLLCILQAQISFPRLLWCTFLKRCMNDMEKPVTNFVKRPKLWPKQKWKLLMQNILKTFIRTGAMVPFPCMVTEAKAKSCFMKPQHRKFTDGDSNYRSVKEMMPSLPETFAKKDSCKQSDIVENAKAEIAAKKHLQHPTSAQSGLKR